MSQKQTDQMTMEELEREELELRVQVLRNQVLLQERELKSIQPNRFYETPEIREILKGRVKLEALRESGLVGFASGYWGGNVIDAIRSHCDKIAVERDPTLPRKEEENGKIFEKTVDGKNRSVVGHHQRQRGMESHRKQLPIQSDRDREREVESQLSEFNGQTKAA